MKSFGIARKNANLTQDDLAKKLGVAKNTVSQWENGKRQPDIQTLIRIADLYGVTLDYLCDHETPNQLSLPKLNDDQILAINMLVRLNAENFRKIFTEISGKFISQNIAN